jgi:hypothetical protein
LTGSAILKWFNSPSSAVRLDDESEEEEQTEKIDQKVLEKFKSDVSAISSNKRSLVV